MKKLTDEEISIISEQVVDMLDGRMRSMITQALHDYTMKDPEQQKNQQ